MPSTNDRLAEIRSTLVDTRIPTRSKRQRSQSRASHHRPLPPAPGQKFVRQRTLERKAKRDAKKIRLRNQPQRPASDALAPATAPVPVKASSEKYQPPSKRPKLADDRSQPQSESASTSSKPMPHSSATKFYSMIASSQLSSSSSQHADDLELAYLEEKLGLSKKSSSKSKLLGEMAEDGLDEIFSLVEGIEKNTLSASERQRLQDEEGIENEPVDWNAPISLASDRGNESSEDDDDDEVQLLPEPDEAELASHYRTDEDEDEDDDSEAIEELGDGESNAHGSGSESDGNDPDDGEADADADATAASRKQPKPSYAEIYGFNGPTPTSLTQFQQSHSTAPQSQSAQPTQSKYVPPHLRQSLASPSSLSSQLEAAVTGRLNKLTQSNIEPITKQLLALYSDNPNATVNEAITTSILHSLVSDINLDSVTKHYLLALAGVIVFLHHKRAEDSFGLNFIETLSRDVEAKITLVLSKPSADAGEAAFQRCNHLLLLLCYLYQLSMVHSQLIVDFLLLLLPSSGPSASNGPAIELLVNALKSIGYSLRKSEPLLLKSLLTTITNSTSTNTSSSDDSGSGRTTYLLSLVDDIKHNKQRFLRENDSELVAPLKNWLANLVKKSQRRELQDHCIRLTRADILNIAVNGRWWKTGAAWNQSNPIQSHASTSNGSARSSVVDNDGSIDYRLLARQHGFTAPLHIAVFASILSSTDFVEAFERLNQLSLQSKDWITVISLIFFLVGKESLPNPFYSHLLNHIVAFVHGSKFTVQIKFFDFFTTILGNERNDDSSTKRQCVNYSRLLSSLLANETKVFSLTLLKPFPFQSLNIYALIFLHTLFDSIFGAAASTVDGIFRTLNPENCSLESKDRGSKAAELEAVRLGVSYFLANYYTGDRKQVKRARQAMGE